MIHFIVNPASKSNHGAQIWNTVEQYLKQNDVTYEVSFSERPGHVEELVRDFTTQHRNDEEIPRLVILGGDGTLNEALQGVVDYDRVMIGYIPTGSSNDFARAMKYSDDPIVTLKGILDCETPRALDLGYLEYLSTTSERSRLHKEEPSLTRYFDVSCGIGFDASICEEALASGGKNFLNRIGLGKLIYVLISFKQLFGAPLADAKLTLDDGSSVSVNKLRFVVGMNTAYEGGGFKFAPKAVPDDGMLDVCMIHNINPVRALTVLPSAYKGNHVKCKKVSIYHVKSFDIVTDIPLWVHTDGEVFVKSTHIRVSCLPGKLQLLV